MIKKTEIFDSFSECNTGNQLLDKINFIMTEMNSSNFQVMSPTEEVKHIIDDVFDGDVNLKNSCIKALCDTYSVTYSEANQDEINDLIIDHEDELYQMVHNQETMIPN